ncbi:MAG: CPBP family intramembrane glutamic endopeptidase [Candidatus Faecousia sp.]|nr:CPBP family intramembrane glutamic endopeptidase [Candidatus Faecousia sp.]
MRKNISARSCPNSQETVGGFCYLAFQLLLLPELLTMLNARLSSPLRESELNFVFYMINFLAVLLIFREFLSSGAQQATRHPAYLCQAVILGLAAYYACRFATEWLVRLLMPGFSNYNDAAIAAMGRENRLLVIIGTVLLVPTVEECFYRGLIFRNLYGKSHWAAYLVSMLAFALIHILGYVGQYTPLEILMAVLQYLPAGLCLAWSYTKADTIFAPIAIHATVNFITLTARR